MLAQIGDGAKLLAGGQSLIPLMKLRFANPRHLIDLNFIPDLSYIKEENGALRFGALTRHAEIENSAIAAKLPIVHDCAAGIADVQVPGRRRREAHADWGFFAHTLMVTNAFCHPELWDLHLIFNSAAARVRRKPCPILKSAL